MRLSALREELLRELSTSETENQFAYAKQTHHELKPYATARAVLAVLENRDASDLAAQDRLLRCLVAQAQGHPEESLWRRLLLCAFIPSLIRIRTRTIEVGQEPDDVDAAVWTSFFEVLHGYPLTRSGFIAAGLVRDTSKAYVRAMRRARLARAHEAELRAAMNHAAASEVRPGVAERAAHAGTVEPEMAREALATLAPQDAELLWATAVEGMSVRRFVQSQGLGREDAGEEAREIQRLKRRRHRALLRLREEIEKKYRS